MSPSALSSKRVGHGPLPPSCCKRLRAFDLQSHTSIGFHGSVYTNTAPADAAHAPTSQSHQGHFNGGIRSRQARTTSAGEPTARSHIQ
jgi:hypothetical protein